MNGFAKNLTANGGFEIENKFNEDTKMNILDENKISKNFIKNRYGKFRRKF